MPRKSNLTRLREDRQKVADLIYNALKDQGWPASQAADQAGIDRSHLSQVLNQKKSLGREKLIVLAEVLGIPQTVLLTAAGHTDTAEKGRLIVRQLFPQNVSGETLKVVTDPRFLDSAIFLWLFSKQPFKSLDIACEPIVVDWRNVPEAVSRQPLAIGFYNRKAEGVRTSKQSKYPIKYWGDLCLYKGYALLGRTADVGQRNFTHAEAMQYLNHLITNVRKNEGRQPVIVSIGGDTTWALKTPLSKQVINDENFYFDPYGDADFALTRFLNGFGHLFIGGLSQRLAAQEDCVELLSYDNDPFLFSLNTLISSERLFEEKKTLLSLITALWYETISEIKANADFRQQMAADILQILDTLGVKNHHLQPDHFAVLLSNQYAFFPTHPAALVDELAATIRAAVKQLSKDDDLVNEAFEGIEKRWEVEDQPKYIH